MKKLILLSVFSVLLFISKSEAQGFRFVTSFGVTQQWDIPYNVYYTLDNQYLGYDWVHARRIYNQGSLFFDVVLQRGDVFVRVSVDRFGRVHNRAVTYSYPFVDHVCSAYCGFHSNFYVSHQHVCTGHAHYGHNHVVYRPVVIYNQSHPSNNGNAYGVYKKKSQPVRQVYQPVNRRSGAVIVTNRDKSRLDLGRGGNGYGVGSGNSNNQGGNGYGYGRGNNGSNGKGNNGNNGNAYGRGKNNGKGNGLGRGRGDGNLSTQDERSSRDQKGNSQQNGSSSRTSSRSRRG